MERIEENLRSIKTLREKGDCKRRKSLHGEFLSLSPSEAGFSFSQCQCFQKFLKQIHQRRIELYKLHTYIDQFPMSQEQNFPEINKTRASVAYLVII